MRRNSLRDTKRTDIVSKFIQYFCEWSFLVVKDVNFASYADDNTIYQSGRNVDDVTNDLQVSAEKRFYWFSDYQMKGNTDKCHLIMSTNNTPELKVRDSLIKESICKKLLGVKIDYKLTFVNHVAKLCKKANNKLRALARATPCMKNSFWRTFSSIRSLITVPLYGCYRVVAITKNQASAWKMFKIDSLRQKFALWRTAGKRWISLYPP